MDSDKVAYGNWNQNLHLRLKMCLVTLMSFVIMFYMLAINVA